VIVSFRSKALERFWWKGEARHVDPRHLKKVRLLLSVLEVAGTPEDMNQPTFGFHRLAGDQNGRFAVKVDKNWRVTFGWSDNGPDAVEVDYEDYH
jgi:toxin HigB-1